ncbi:MAG: hypothetical protein KJO64_00100, partial [Bacteroidia bacterium]|nr:hypothetical protein [Bacteroidia bacterium]
MRHYLLILLVMFLQLSCNKDNTGTFSPNPYPDYNIPNGVYDATHSCSILGSKNSTEFVGVYSSWPGTSPYYIQNFAGVGATLLGGYINGRKIRFSSFQALTGSNFGIVVISCEGTVNSNNHITSLTYKIRD